MVGDREGRINERNKKSGKYANDWQGEEDRGPGGNGASRTNAFLDFFSPFFKKSVR